MGRDWRLIDAWIGLAAHPLAFVTIGQHMVPSARQGVTSADAMLSIERPGTQYKALTWGTRSMSTQGTRTFGDADAGLRGEEAVRDTGVTLLGRHSFSDSLHAKYYAGVYDGIQLAGADHPRLTARAQFNVLDPEPGYFNKACYLGAKRTVAVGASVDTQSEVAPRDDGGAADYLFYTVDVFAELPLGPGHATFEAAYATLDLDGAVALDHDGDEATAPRDATRAEGDGFYLQAGYLLGSWQPWAAFEHWDSEASDGRGSHHLYRAGVTYYIRGFHANIKAGYERLVADLPIGGTDENTIDSFVAGVYLDY